MSEEQKEFRCLILTAFCSRDYAVKRNLIDHPILNFRKVKVNFREGCPIKLKISFISKALRRQQQQ